MALFKHLLPRRSLRGGCEKRVSPSNDEHNNRGEFETPLFGDLCYKREYTLTKNDLRLVIISENERRLLYDSETVQLAKSGDVASSTPSSCGQFLFLRHRSDISAIGQMMFGSMASTKTDSFKIHHLSVGNRLLLSRVINVPKSSKSLSSECRNLIDNISCGECDSPYSTIRSLEGMRERKHRLSKSTEPPDGFTRSRNSSLQLDNEDISSVCFDKERAFSPNKLSKTRRIILSQKADLCDENNSGRWSSRSRLSSCSSVTDDDVRQVAIGLLFNESERNFVLQHLALLETEIVKLEAQLIKASLSKTRFIHIIYQAWMEFIRSVCLLYNSPRLLNPVWLSLLRDETYDDAAASFCSHLASLIRSLDSKTTGFFLSNLLSCVLMNHLAWVASVAPPERCQDTQRSLLLGTAADAEMLSVSYNASLAQFMEINGSVGGAVRLAHTVVLGSSVHLISEVLYVLSYFVRCSSIRSTGENASRWMKSPEMESFSPGSLHKLSEEASSDDTRTASEAHILPQADTLSSSPCSSQDFFPCERQSDWELPMSEIILRNRSEADFCLARSLLAGPCEAYCSHFVLSGLSKTNIDINQTYALICNHVRSTETELMNLSSPDSSTSSMGSDSTPPSPIVVVFADIDTYCVKVVSGNEANIEENEMSAPCEAVVSTLEQFLDLYTLGAAPTFLISYIEDSLSDLLGKSISLVELIREGDSSETLTIPASRVASVIGCDYSDLRLIANVAAVYFPSILQAMA